MIEIVSTIWEFLLIATCSFLLTIVAMAVYIGSTQKLPTVEDNLKSTVIIENGEAGIGSGVIVDSTHVLTAFHVVRDNTAPFKSVIFFGTGERKNPAKIIAIDTTSDLALLELDKPTEFPAATFQCKTPTIGSEIYAVGAPFNYRWMIRWGHVASGEFLQQNGQYFPPEQFLQNEMLYSSDLLAMPGNSGGPVFNRYGKVSGIVDAIARKGADPFGGFYFHISYLIAPEQYCMFLDKNQINYKGKSQ